MPTTAQPQAGILDARVDDFRPDPHAGFAKYRARSALINLGGHLPLAIRHGDVTRLMTDARTCQMETEPLTMRGITDGDLYRFLDRSMLQSNPPFHSRRRRPAAKSFFPSLIEAWRPRIRALVTEILQGLDDEPQFDFLQQVAAPLPSRLIGEILGAPPADAPWFSERVQVMSRGLTAFREADFPNIDAAARDLTLYVQNLLEDRRARPRDDFLTDYIARAGEDPDLTDAETVIQIVTLILAGSDTTRFGVTSTLSLLLQHPSQWDALCANPGLAKGAVLESLRFEPPVGSIGRVVVDPMEIGGIPLPSGTFVALSILSAQRDPAVYDAPDRFDIHRTDQPRLSLNFGLGAHRCLGEHLARAEMEELLIAVTSRWPGLRFAAPPPNTLGFTGIRGIEPLILTAA